MANTFKGMILEKISTKSIHFITIWPTKYTCIIPHILKREREIERASFHVIYATSAKPKSDATEHCI